MIERFTTRHASILLTTELPEPTGNFERFAEALRRKKLKEENLESLADVDIPEWKNGWMIFAKVFEDLSTKKVFIDITMLNPCPHGVNDGKGLLHFLERRSELLNQPQVDMRAVVDCNKKITHWYGDYATCPTQFEIDLLFPTVRKLLESKGIIQEGTEVVVGSNFLWIGHPKKFQREYKSPQYPSNIVFTHIISASKKE